MNSPPRLRRSPKRKALHERSDSHTNEILSPTLRVVGDEDAKVYASTPFPTRESQVLSPPGRSLFDSDVSVSQGSEPTLGQPRTPDHIKEHGHTQSSPSPHNGSDSELSQPDTESPSSLDAKEPLQSAESPSSIGVDRPDMDGVVFHYERVSDEIVQLPSIFGSSDVRGRTLGPGPVTPNRDNRPSLRAIASVASQLSIDSAGSNETVIKSKVFGPPPRGSYTLFPLAPRPSSSRSTRSVSAPARPADIEVHRVSLSPVSSTSPTSPVSPLSSGSPTFEPPPARLYQAPQYARSDTALSTALAGAADNPRPPSSLPAALQIQYPIIRPAAASGFFMASGSSSTSGSNFRIPRRPVGGYPAGGHKRISSEKWNTNLSTILSEGSDERSSPRTAARDTGIFSMTSSMLVDRSSSSSWTPPIPPKSPYRSQRDITGSTIRVVNEEEDDIPSLPLPTTVLPGQTERFYNLPAAARGANGALVTRQGTGSRGNLFRDSIPAWARYLKRNGLRRRAQTLPSIGNTDTLQRTYYANEGRTVLPPIDSEPADSRPPTQRSQSSFAYGIFRTRTRTQHREIATRPPTQDSMAITPANANDNSVIHTNTVVEVRSSPKKRTSPSWSPHLWHDRRSAMNRRTIFIAPSLDEAAEGKALTRRNAQVWLFAVGFMLPLAWIVAAFLPLPPAPILTPLASPSPTIIAHDIEKAPGPIDQARYENARWWRNINRFLSIIGVLIIVAIIALAAVGSRSH